MFPVKILFLQWSILLSKVPEFTQHDAQSSEMNTNYDDNDFDDSEDDNGDINDDDLSL